jgi:integrase
MANIKFRLQNKNSEKSPIRVRINLGRGADFQVNTGFSISTKDWNEKINRPKKTDEVNKKLYNDLLKLEGYLENRINVDMGTSTLFDKYWLHQQIKECFGRLDTKSAGLLTNHIQFMIDNAHNRKIKGRKHLGISESRIKSYKTFKGLVEDYQRHKNKTLSLLDINKRVVDSFTNWLIKTRNYSINYSGKQIDNLKTVGLDAIKNGIPTNEYVNHIESFSESNEDRFIVTLSFEELAILRNTQFKSQALINARNWILLGCEIGQRGGDLLNLTTENLRYKGNTLYIDLIQEKTKKNITVGLVDHHIIEMVENNFPYKISSQKLNQYIKKVCKKAGINEVIEGKKFNKETKRKELGHFPKYELITTHCFRRSFASNYYRKIPTPILINITGHSKESLFISYINQREDKDTNADLFMKFYQEMNKEQEPKLRLVK